MRTNRQMLIMCLLFSGFAFVRVGLGEPADVKLPSELTGLVQRYDQELAAIEVASSNQQYLVLDSYRGSVSTLEMEERRAGNLDGVLECRNEQERIANQGRLPTNVSAHVSLGNLQRAFGEQWRSLDRERLLRRSMLARQYLQALDQLKRELVRGGRLADAKAVQAEETRIHACLQPPPSPPAPRPLAGNRPPKSATTRETIVWDFSARPPDGARRAGTGRFAINRDGLLAEDYGFGDTDYYGPEIHLPTKYTGNFRLEAEVLYSSLEGLEAGYLQIVVRFADQAEIAYRVMDHNDQVPEVVEMVSDRARVITRKAPRFGRAEWQGREVAIERTGPKVTVWSGGELLTTVHDVSTNRLTEIVIMAHRIVGRSSPLARVGLRSLTLSRPEQKHQDKPR